MWKKKEKTERYPEPHYEVLETLAEWACGKSVKKEIRRVLSDKERLDFRLYYYSGEKMKWFPTKGGISVDYKTAQDKLLPAILTFFKRNDPIWYDHFVKTLNVTKPVQPNCSDGDIHIDV